MRLTGFILAALCAASVGLCAQAAEKNTGQGYTDTDRRTCTLAVRADVFEAFSGEVEVTLEDGFGKEESCTLTAENGYAQNLAVAEGCFTAKTVKAEMNGRRYEVKKLSSRILAADGEVAVCRLVVTDYEIVEEETVLSSDGEEKEESMEKQETTYAKKEKGEKKPLFGRRFSLALWLAALAAAAAYWYFHYGRRKYSGR